jgi:pimeloyl-ACP methyl ester carboxylesterase
MLEPVRHIAINPTPRTEPSVEIVRGADGAHLYCVHAGTGPSVLLAHGYLLEHAFFDLVFAELVRCGHRVIAFDQRGHGRSVGGSEGYKPAAAASDYAAILNHFDVRDGVLVAHSMGSFLGLAFCLQHAELARRRLRRLVLLGGTAGEVGKGSLQNRFQMPVLKSGLITQLWRFPPTGRALVSQLFGKSPDPRFIELTRAMLMRQDVRLSLPLLHALTNDSYYDRLNEIPLETRILCGDLDRTCPPSHSRRLGTGLPNARSRWLPGIGHMLAYEAPDAVVEAVREP